MKAILMSIKPKWVSKILNGKKTLEIRKTFPKCDLPIDVYIYCTKGNGIKDFITMYKHDLATDEIGGCYINGTIIAKFTLNKVEEIKCLPNTYQYETRNRNMISLIKSACLDAGTLDNYLNRKNGYAWHIDDLEIFDKPKEISEFKRVPYEKCNKKDKNGKVYCGKCPYGYEDGYYCECRYNKPLKAPQSWQFIEV